MSFDPNKLSAAAVSAACGWPKGSESAAVASVTIARFLDALLADDEAMKRMQRAYYEDRTVPRESWVSMRAALTAAVQEPRAKPTMTNSTQEG